MAPFLAGALRRAPEALLWLIVIQGCHGQPGGATAASAPAAAGNATTAEPTAAASTPAAAGNATTAEPVDARCAWPAAPVVVRQDGASVLQYWDLEDKELWFEPLLPDDAAYLGYRAVIRQAGGDVVEPVADEPEPGDEQQRELMRRERFNAELAYSGRAGRIRPIQCLEALLFAYQNNRYSQIEHPTEFLGSMVRKEIDGRGVIRVFFSASDIMFPPKNFYGFDEVQALLGQGWSHWVMLHNHTVQSYRGRVALGAPTLSTSDVHLVRNLARDRGLEQARVTNGFFTIEVPASDFGLFQARE